MLIGLGVPGSPPLTRGIRCNLADLHYKIRFTPAHAGNTKIQRRARKSARVHPRSRGEYCFFLFLRLLLLGSPPLTRGIH